MHDQKSFWIDLGMALSYQSRHFAASLRLVLSCVLFAFNVLSRVIIQNLGHTQHCLGLKYTIGKCSIGEGSHAVVADN